jgi:Cof subfamily protein (haloacid dehalogenase superfamily)
MMKPKLIVTDFDGTLAGASGTVSEKNRETLAALGEKKHVRVIATGRNLYSVHKVIEPSFPVDYVIFTTGAGMIHWPTQKIMVSHHLEKDSIQTAFDCLKQKQIDFMIHEPIPNNHVFYCFETGLQNSDFAFRKEHYGNYCQPGNWASIPECATQFVAVLRPDQKESVYESVRSDLKAVNVVRATSPFDHNTIWVEIFSKKAGKHFTAEFLAQKLNIPVSETIAIGNDYNDVELLNWAGRSFAVENAISELKTRHEIVAHAEQDGFSEAVDRVLLKNGS